MFDDSFDWIAWSLKTALKCVAIHLINMLVAVVFEECFGLNRARECGILQFATLLLWLKLVLGNYIRHQWQGALSCPTHKAEFFHYGLCSCSGSLLLLEEPSLHLLRKQAWISVGVHVPQ